MAIISDLFGLKEWWYRVKIQRRTGSLYPEFASAVWDLSAGIDHGPERIAGAGKPLYPG
jgi:hypothetical protein